MENTNIAKKLLAVMAECAYVAKNGLNSFHKYKYATAEDVLQKVNEALTKNKIACVAVPELIEFTDVTNLKGNTEHLATVRVEISLIDGDSGEEVKIYGIGSGQDAGDKAVMKAQTAATKYAICLASALPLVMIRKQIARLMKIITLNRRVQQQNKSLLLIKQR